MKHRSPLSILAASALVLAAGSPAFAEDTTPTAQAPQSASSVEATPSAGAPGGDKATIDLVTISDFHGHIARVLDKSTKAVKEPGALTLSCEVNAARQANPNTLFISNGDNVGGSAYISSILEDNPTIDVLNAMKLDVTSAGNHEFDKGMVDLEKHIMARLDAPILAANVTGNAALSAEGDGDGTFIKEIGGVTVGFVGVVTEELPSLVSSSALEGLSVVPAIETANVRAKALKTKGVDLVVVLAHADASLYSPLLSDDVDAFVGGHSHLEYVNELTLRSGKKIPVIEPASYGMLLGKISFTLEKSGENWKVSENSAKNIDLRASTCQEDPYGVGAIVSKAQTDSEAAGSKVIAQLGSNFYRGTNTGSDFEGKNRSTESTASNLIADSFHAWLKGFAPKADHLVGVMNPGGVRADYAKGDLTEGQAFTVQPFGNEMAYATYTGAQFTKVLSEQFQPTTSRPALILGVSDNVEVYFDQAAVGELEGYWQQINATSEDKKAGLIAQLESKIADAHARVISRVLIDGKDLRDDASVVVASNSFLLAGGDNFTTLGKEKMTNTGILDRTATSDYLKSFTTPLSADLRKRQIGVSAKVEVGSAKIDLAGVLFTVTAEQGTGAAVASVSASVAMPDGSTKELAKAKVDPRVTPGMPDTGQASLSVTIPEGVARDSCPTGVAGEQCAKIVLTLTGVDGSIRVLPSVVSVPLSASVVPVLPDTKPDTPDTKPDTPSASKTPAQTTQPSRLSKTGADAAGLLGAALALGLAGAVVRARKR